MRASKLAASPRQTRQHHGFPGMSLKSPREPARPTPLPFTGLSDHLTAAVSRRDAGGAVYATDFRFDTTSLKIFVLIRGAR
jgi:hypothetical protein